MLFSGSTLPPAVIIKKGAKKALSAFKYGRTAVRPYVNSKLFSSILGF
jgi:hypothetical protein